jgi:hypothetical protein
MAKMTSARRFWLLALPLHDIPVIASFRAPIVPALGQRRLDRRFDRERLNRMASPILNLNTP